MHSPLSHFRARSFDGPTQSMDFFAVYLWIVKEISCLFAKWPCRVNAVQRRSDLQVTIIRFHFPGRISLPYLPAYVVSKYGVAAFSDALRREMLPWGVRVSIIEAGAHKTKLLSGDTLTEQWQSEWNELSDELKQEYGAEGLQKGTYCKKKSETKFTGGRGG